MAQGTIAQTEPDDSIGTANATGFTAGSSGIKVAFGNNGDGPYGQTGNQTGDVDFYKVTVAAGQVIFVNLNNAGIDPDFDPYVGLYDSTGAVVAENDDEGDTSRGYDRTSRFTYTATAAGDYYVCVSNWIGDFNLPNDPFTPGTAPGMPAGHAGPYQLFIGVDVKVPVPQFVGGSTGYPVPAFLPVKVQGTPRYDGVLTLRNTSTGASPAADYVISSYSITGANASRFSVSGLTTPLTIPPGGQVNVNVSFNSGGAGGLSEAVLNLVSNDPFAQNFVLNTYGSPVVGGGSFAAKQVSATGTTVNSIDIADQLLDGTLAGTTYNSQTPVINFGGGADGHYGSDNNFPIGATPGDNFVLQVTGTFYIRTAGLYTFLGYSDDGQRLKIDGEELYSYGDYNVDHLVTVDLTAGAHTVEFTMYEGGGGNSAELLISKQPGEFTRFIDSTWELLEAYSADADGDGMPNEYELANGTNPDVADANVDLDGDGLTNIQEYALGTKPNVADTDGDGLKDGVETGTGTWVSATNTGTNPLVADTDGDGLLDGVENPDLASTGPAQPGSNPNKKDTDGDGYADLSEVTLGTDPKSAASNPGFNFQPALVETFDSTGFHSNYTFNSLNATTTFVAGVYESDVAAHGQVAQLSNYQTGSHNSLTFDYVDLPSAPAVQVSFDFRIGAQDTNPADGFGFGLFRKGVYGTAGFSTAITDGKAWENPTGAGGYGDALYIGFGIYGTDVIRMTGPAAPTVPVASVNTSFPLAPVENPYNRAVLTVITNGADSSMVKLEIIQDPTGAATRQVIFDNVLVPGFRIASEDFRLIAGARTGASVSQTEIDNVMIAIPMQATPSLVLSNTTNSFVADIYDAAAVGVNASTMAVTLNGTPVTVTTTKTGTLTNVTYTGAAGSFFPSGTNTLVFSYTTTTGTPVTETRTFTPGTYTVIPASLALPASSAGAGGFKVRTVQMDPVVLGTAEAPTLQTTPNSLDYMEGVLNGVTGTPFIGGNVADLTGAVGGYLHADVINFEQDSLAAGFFGGETLIPGIPGNPTVNGVTDNYAFEALTWVNFPIAGVYNFGVVADDGFRVSYGHDAAPAFSVVSPAASARIVPYLPSIRDSQIGGIAAAYPATPITASVIMADPPTATNTADSTGLLNNAAAVAGKILLIDRGAGTFVTKIRTAQAAGAVAAIIINENNPNSFPAGLGGDGSDLTTITIPAGMIAKGDGDKLKALIASGLQMKLGVDTTTTLGKSDPNQTTYFSAAVPTPGLYPIRFFNFEGGGGANAEWFSIDSVGVKHLINDPNDDSALKAYSTVVAGTTPTISVSSTGGAVVITFTGTLQSSTNLQSWTAVQGATSPYTVPAGSPARLFFRAVAQ